MRKDATPKRAQSLQNKAKCALACLALAWAGGCGDVTFNWESQQAQPRPVVQPAGRVVTPSDEAKGGPQPPAQATAQASPPAAPAPSVEPAANAGTPTRSPVSVHQLVLLSQAGPAEAPPGLKHVRLLQARARDVANVLKVLYVPAGPSGTDHRYTLVYATSLECDLAAQAARQLDVGTAADRPAGETAGDAWRWGVATSFEALENPAAPPERLREIARRLSTCSASTQLTPWQRWAAALLAGELLAHRLYDYAAAASVYQQIEVTVEPGSYEQMALIYAQARAFQQDGRRDQARRCFETILGQFSTLRGCDVFERSREILAQWQGRPQG